MLLYDIMTERYEITSILQRELACIPAVCGELDKGTPEDPAVIEESVHTFIKSVAGSPLIRPAWFFDVGQQGEGLVDVGTHLVDLVQWECFPEQALDAKTDIQDLHARHWPTEIPEASFREVTGLKGFPPFLKEAVSPGRWKILIPQRYRIGHEAHFAEVTERFLHFLAQGHLPAWEVPNMIAKCYTTTTALARISHEP